MNIENDKNANIKDIKAFWYIPIEQKKFEERKDENIFGCIIYKKIEDYYVLCIELNDIKGEFDEYLYGLMSELFYVQSACKIYKDYKEGIDLDNKLDVLNSIDEIHNDNIVLKRLYYKVLIHLKRLAEYSVSHPDIRRSLYVNNSYIEELYRYFYIDYYRNYYRDSFWNNIMHRNFIEEFISLLYDYLGINIFEKYGTKVDLINPVLSGLGISTNSFINCLINIWTAMFCIELGIDNSSISIDDVLSGNILMDNINAVDLALGKNQMHCIVCYLTCSEDEYSKLIESNVRIRKFISILKGIENLKQYWKEKKGRCYSQMWIDDVDTNYFALSGHPHYDKIEKYYAELVQKLGNEKLHFEQAKFTEEMRYYYDLGKYIKYSEIKNNEIITEGEIGNMFSCCERKLLIKVDNYGNSHQLSDKKVHMCVKYPACEICRRALNSYENDGIEFEIIVPGENRNSDKFLTIDNKIKSLINKNDIM